MRTCNCFCVSCIYLQRYLAGYPSRGKRLIEDKGKAGVELERAGQNAVGPTKFEACKPRYVIHLVIISPAREVYECYRSSRESWKYSGRCTCYRNIESKQNTGWEIYEKYQVERAKFIAFSKIKDFFEILYNTHRKLYRIYRIYWIVMYRIILHIQNYIATYSLKNYNKLQVYE